VFERSVRRHEVQDAIAYASVIFAPRHFVRIEIQVGTGDMVVDADFRAAETAEKAFRHVGRRVAVTPRLLRFGSPSSTPHLCGGECRTPLTDFSHYVGLHQAGESSWGG
jgi:hypothetical protein